MKLGTLFSFIKNTLSNIRIMHVFNYEITSKKREKFWKEECKSHQTNSTCKTYEV